jgi:hypothetical protein
MVTEQRPHGHLRVVAPDEPATDLDAKMDPFAEYRAAGLVNARFGIDGAPPYFWGYIHPGQTWNGWDTPRFGKQVAELIAEWVTSPDEVSTWWWDGDDLAIRLPGAENIEILVPDHLGLYQFDGWSWTELQA